MTLKESLMTIKDFRIDRCKKHNLCDILMIVLIGYLTGCKDLMKICFGQVKTEEKSNEITAIPELLELLELKGLIVTIDAMGCQKKIAEKIVEKKADYLFSLKGNQEKIHEDVKDFFNHELDEKYCERYKIQKLSCAVEKDHGHIEKRDYYLCTNLKWLV